MKGTIAIVHERLTEMGGSEKVVLQMLALFPDATLFTPIADRAIVERDFSHVRIRTSSLQKLYAGGPRYSHLMPLLPAAMRSFDLSGFDLVITSSHAFANRVRPPQHVPILSYTYTPARWIWDSSTRAGEIGGRFGKLGLTAFAATQRRSDRGAAERADRIVAISAAVADRIQRFWRRTAAVIYPPVDTTFYAPASDVAREDFFLLAGRLVPYKQPHIAVEAARRAGVRLIVAGEGRLRKSLQEIHAPTVEFLGRVTDSELRDLYRSCRALVFPGVEDFGLVPVEAQACGSPVIAAAAGGAVETVRGTTGILLPVPEITGPDRWARAFREFEPNVFDSGMIREHALRFSIGRFHSAFQTAVEDTMRPRTGTSALGVEQR